VLIVLLTVISIGFILLLLVVIAVAVAIWCRRMKRELPREADMTMARNEAYGDIMPRNESDYEEIHVYEAVM
jgi:Na+-transporting methylmalonyl-CoA/oxaloacetate decarboxylase gamma subunit